MGKSLTLLVSVACYLAFFVAFLYLIAFVAAFPPLPTNVDKGLTAPMPIAVVVDVALIALFGLQHSVMARPGFKAGWTKVIPASLERSVFCLASALALVAMFALWHSIPVTIWHVADPTWRVVLWVLFFVGWGILFIATLLINHFELFGLSQAWHHFRGTSAPPPQFRTPLFYRWVRHPIYSGFLLAFWATPDMTYSHALLAFGLSIYIFVGIAYEERDLMGHFGQTYADYRRRVGMVVPGIGRSRRPAAIADEA
jgi:protein-S-isoprenylcysteine O-methyltransferase Ste14